MEAELLKKNALVRIRVPGVMGNSRKLDISDKMVEEAVGPLPDNISEQDRRSIYKAARARLRASKKLIVCKELDAATSTLQAAKTELERLYCNPSFIDDGWFTVRLDMIGSFAKAVRMLNENTIRPAIEAFANVYAQEIQNARTALGASFREDQYPSVDRIRAHPGITFNTVTFNIPDGLPPEIREEEERKLRARFESAQAEITAALWTEFQGLIDHLKERLEPGENGKTKILRTTTVENLTLFVEAFSNRNAFGDDRLSGLVEKAGEILKGIGDDPVAKLRDFDGVRKGVAEAFGGLKIAVDKGVSDLPSRTFGVDDEEEAA